MSLYGQSIQFESLFLFVNQNPNARGRSANQRDKRTDGLNPLVQQVNSLIEKGLKSESNIDFINNDTISEYHLNSSGLHLNRKGDAALARNIIQYIKSRSSL